MSFTVRILTSQNTLTMSSFDEIFNTNRNRINNIYKSFINTSPNEDDGGDSIEKARALPVGTIRTHGGKKVIKTAQGWKPHTESKDKSERTYGQKVELTAKHHGVSIDVINQLVAAHKSGKDTSSTIKKTKPKRDSDAWKNRFKQHSNKVGNLRDTDEYSWIEQKTDDYWRQSLNGHAKALSKL